MCAYIYVWMNVFVYTLLVTAKPKISLSLYFIHGIEHYKARIMVLVNVKAFRTECILKLVCIYHTLICELCINCTFHLEKLYLRMMKLISRCFQHEFVSVDNKSITLSDMTLIIVRILAESTFLEADR